jgi:hypothetical protein
MIFYLLNNLVTLVALDFKELVVILVLVVHLDLVEILELVLVQILVLKI